jgi:hypothetical protein
MDSENPADHIFVDLDAEGQSDLLCNSLAAPREIAPFHLISTTASISSFVGPLGPGRRTRFGENSSRYFCLIRIL